MNEPRDMPPMNADVQRHWSVVADVGELRQRGEPTLNAAARRTLRSRWSLAD
jgi:hypothetical protein